MKALAAVLTTASGPKAERLAAQRTFLKKRRQIWQEIHAGVFPAVYVSANNKKFVGAPRRTAIRCDFLLASKIALGPKYAKDHIADMAQRAVVLRASR